MQYVRDQLDDSNIDFLNPIPPSLHASLPPSQELLNALDEIVAALFGQHDFEDSTLEVDEKNEFAAAVAKESREENARLAVDIALLKAARGKTGLTDAERVHFDARIVELTGRLAEVEEEDDDDDEEEEGEERRHRARGRPRSHAEGGMRMSRPERMQLARRAIARKLTMMGRHFRNAMACALTMDAGEDYDAVIDMYEIEINAYVRVLKSVCVLQPPSCYSWLRLHRIGPTRVCMS
jgi:hypothetical protein